MDSGGQEPGAGCLGSDTGDSAGDGNVLNLESGGGYKFVKLIDMYILWIYRHQMGAFYCI